MLFKDNIKLARDMTKSNKNIQVMKKISLPRAVVCKLFRFNIQKKIIQNSKKLKNIDIFIYEYISKDIMVFRKKLREKVFEHRAGNKIAYVNTRSIVIRNQNFVSLNFLFCHLPRNLICDF